MRPDAIRLALSPAEWLMAGTLGVYRHLSSRENGLDDGMHAEATDWDIDIEGAAAEMAMAKWLGMYFEPRNLNFKGPDVGARCQVRSTGYSNGHLPLRKRDQKIRTQPFVLAVVQYPLINCVGWIIGQDGMTDHYWNEDRWWVPQADLVSMDKFDRKDV